MSKIWTTPVTLAMQDSAVEKAHQHQDCMSDQVILLTSPIEQASDGVASFCVADKDNMLDFHLPKHSE